MFAKVEEIEERYAELEADLGRPEVIRDQKTYQAYAKERSALAPIVNSFREFKSLQEEIASSRLLLDDPDPDIRHLAKEEIDALGAGGSAEKPSIDLSGIISYFG